MTTGTEYIVTIYDATTGAPLAGLAAGAVWLTYVDQLTGTSGTAPTIAEVGGGIYSVPLVSVAGSRFVGLIDFGAAANPRYVEYDSPFVAPGSSGTPGSGAWPARTLATLRLAAQQRADRPSSGTGGFIPDAEWDSYINLSYAEYYDLLVARYGEVYFAKESTITTTGLVDVFALPVDFYKLLGVDVAMAGAGSPMRWLPVRPFNMADRTRFLAIPPAGQVLQLRYVPRVSQLVADSDIADDPAGWLDYVVIDAAMKALQKEESDASHLERQKVAMTKRIEDMATNRDAGGIRTVRDTQSLGGFGLGGMGGFGGSMMVGIQQTLRYKLYGNSLWLRSTSNLFGGGY